MYDELKTLFGKKPSVSKFETLLSEFTPVRRLQRTGNALFIRMGLSDGRLQNVLTDFLTRDWQRSIDYLLEHTVLGELRSSCKRTGWYHPAFYRSDGREAFNRQGFFLSIWLFLSRLSFSYDYNIEYFGDKLVRILTLPTLICWKDKTPVTNGRYTHTSHPGEISIKNRGRGLR